MKRILFVVVCFSMLLLSGCANGFLGCGNTCNNNGLLNGGLFNRGTNIGNGPFSDGPVRRWLRGDECSTCNAPAGQQFIDGNSAPLCDACGQAAPAFNAGQPIMADPYAQPMSTNPIAPAPIENGNTINSFYPEYNGATIDGPVLDGSSINSGQPIPMTDNFGAGAMDFKVEPPFNSSIDMNN